MFRRVRAAAANFVPWKGHKEWNAERIEKFYVTAANAGADIVVLPECALDGGIVWEALADRRWWDTVLTIAEPLDGPYVQRFRKLARKYRTAMVFGMAEKKADGVYNSAVFIDNEGTLCGAYSKCQFAEGYDESWDFNRLGSELRSIPTPYGRCGLAICFDRWNPLIPRAQVLDGAQFLCILTAGVRTRMNDDAVLARARENGVPIIQSNIGGNLIVSKGEIVARDRSKDVITIADVDIPAPVSETNARTLERQFLEERPAHMASRLPAALQRVKEMPKPVAPDRLPKPRNREPRVVLHESDAP